MAITIGDLANETGVKTRTIRFYEEKGLLPRPRRSESGYRLYSEQDIKLLRLVRSARSLGLSIREVGELLAMRSEFNCQRAFRASTRAAQRPVANCIRWSR